MYDSIKTPADLDALPTPVILDMFNKLTGKATKKFNTRAKGVEQTFRALQAKRTDAPAPETKATKKVTKPTGDTPKAKRKVSGVPRHGGLSFRMGPISPRVTKRRQKSTRAKILTFLTQRQNEGIETTLDDVRESFGLNRKDGYEHIRNLNWYWGLGLWSEDRGDENCTIQLVNEDEFYALVVEAKNEEA